MSVRAYKIIKKELEKNPTFNCWNNGHIVDLAGNNEQYSDGGVLYFEKEYIEEILSDWLENDKNGEIIDSDVNNKDSITILKNIIKDCGDNDYVEYECY